MTKRGVWRFEVDILTLLVVILIVAWLVGGFVVPVGGSAIHPPAADHHRGDRHREVAARAGRMTPVELEPREGERLLTFAKDQPEYVPLPVSVDADGCVTSVRVRLCVHTFDPELGEPGHYLQPVSLDVLPPECGMRES
jgi:hypothetical protein